MLCGKRVGRPRRRGSLRYAKECASACALSPLQPMCSWWALHLAWDGPKEWACCPPCCPPHDCCALSLNAEAWHGRCRTCCDLCLCPHALPCAQSMSRVSTPCPSFLLCAQRQRYRRFWGPHSPERYLARTA